MSCNSVTRRGCYTVQRAGHACMCGVAHFRTSTAGRAAKLAGVSLHLQASLLSQRQVHSHLHHGRRIAQLACSQLLAQALLLHQPRACGEGLRCHYQCAFGSHPSTADLAVPTCSGTAAEGSSNKSVQAAHLGSTRRRRQRVQQLLVLAHQLSSQAGSVCPRCLSALHHKVKQV